MRRQATHGFTLIELLVVCSVIVLLVSMLLPALSAARETAKRATCGSNQRQVAIASVAYATENVDYLPDQGSEVVSAGGAVWLLNVCYDKDFKVGGVIPPHGPAALYELRYVTSPDVFYCPSQRYLVLTREYYPDPWGAIPSVPGEDKVRSSFQYRPYRKSPTSSKRGYPRLSELPPQKLLSLDTVHTYLNIPHATGGEPAWNLTRADGSVRLSGSAAAADYMTDVTSVNWTRFERIRDFLNGERTRPD